MARKLDKESYSYYKNAYNSRKRRVEKSGYTMHDDSVLTKAEWEYYRKSGLNNKQIIDTQAYVKTKKQAKAIKEAYKKQGKKVKESEILYGNGADELEKLITEKYDELRDDGADSITAQKVISEEFWGSPS